MRQILSFILLTCLATVAFAQQRYDLLLRNGNVEMPENAEAFVRDYRLDPSKQFATRFYLVVQFAAIPSQSEKEAMQAEGLRFLDYLPYNAYVVSIPRTYEMRKLLNHGARSFMEPNERLRFAKPLYTGQYPSWAVDGDMIEVMVSPYSDITKEAILPELRKYYEVVGEDLHPRNIHLRLATNRLHHLLQFPYIQYVEPIAAPSTPDDFAGRSLHRSNAINTDYGAGRHYDGTGVTVGLADDGIIGPHIDQTGRVTQFATTNSGTHGDMTSGIFFGAGNREPKVRGHASGAYCYYWDISGYVHIVSAVANFNSYGLVLTSTSYSQGTGGVYTTDAQTIDNQIYNNRQLEHVFSAGNAGSADHGYGAGAGWGNITGGYKAAKSVITCGDMNNSGVLESTSSRGPADDGRIKPDICANGFGQLSTGENNTTQTGSGTSAAAPSIAGTTTQLYHAYKTLNGGQNPESALIKACILNTGNDVGNAGPDYKHGWGHINALRAVRLLEQNQYMLDSVTQGQTKTHSINIPANTQEVRVMVYWADPGGNPSAAKALVNDINIQLTAGTTYNPWKLDPTPNATNLNTPAVRGIDDLNNMEQVTVTNPAAGTATLTVNGFAIPQGPQRYWVVYEFLQTGVELTYPIGGEGFVPGEVEKLRWDANGITGTFALEYSTNNGSTWTSINANVANNLRFLNWTIPANVTGTALVRVSSGGYTDQSDANFTIARLPSNIAISYVCPDSIGITWTGATGATGYEVSILGSKYMDSVAQSTSTSAIIRNQNPNVEHWYSVRALQGNGKGRRAIAVYRAGGTFNCPVPIDAAMTQVLSPGVGNLASCQATAANPVTVVVTNNSNSPVTNVPVAYRLNGGAVNTGSIAGPIATGASASYTFPSTVNMSAPGTYNLSTWVGLTGDGNRYNDTLHQTTTIVPSVLTNLPQNQDFESMTACGVATDCGATVCALNNGWTNNPNGVVDDIDWRVNSGTTASTGTGPSTDHTLNNTVGKYVYLEASACFGAEAQLVSPCIDLSSSVAPQLSFWYHLYGAGMGTLHVDVMANGVWTLDVIPAISGDQGNQWVQAYANLTPFIGSIINIRFRGVTGAVFTSDMALDDIGIIEASAPPVAAFVGSPTTTCPGNTVTLTDQSSNSPNAWAWTITPNTFSFVGGTTANSQNPQLQFSAPGTYTVTMVATNGFGNNTVTQSNYINITNGSAPNFVEDFQGSFIPTGWSIATSGGNYTWAQSVSITGASGAPTLAAYVENFSYNNPGVEDFMVTFPVDLTSASQATMTFDVAYATFSATLFDALRIDLSTDCGQTWPNVVYNKSDTTLATVPSQNANWFPSASTDWRNESVNLSAYAGQRVVLRFVNINGYGNNLFVDNVNISTTVSNDHGLTDIGVTVWPNPSNGFFHVSVAELPVGTTHLQVSDLAGRKVWAGDVQGNGGGWQGQLDLRSLARGVYYLRVEADNYRTVRKLVVE